MGLAPSSFSRCLTSAVRADYRAAFLKRAEATMITGKTLIAWGYPPGRWFANAIAAAEKAHASGADEAAIRAIVDSFAPPPAPKPVPLRAQGAVPFTLNIRAEEPEDADNITSVERHMAALMRVP